VIPGYFIKTSKLIKYQAQKGNFLTEKQAQRALIRKLKKIEPAG